jgi:site-specific recombinase XerD
MTISFICRASKARKSGLSPIELSVIIGGDRSIITLDRQVHHTKFNAKTQCVKGDKDLTTYLEVIRRKCYTIEMELIKMDNFDLDTFVHSFKYGIPKKQDTLLAIYDKHNELYKQSYLCGKVNETSYYKYCMNRNRLSEYLKTLGKDDIRVRDITPMFVENFQNYCLKKLKTNTTNKQMKMFKKILNFAVRERYLDVSPFQLVLKEEKLEYDVLSKDEITALYGHKFLDKRIEGIRDMFVFQCYTGLSYSDLSTLSKDDINDDVIIKRRQKTDVQFVIPLLPLAKEILEKYDYELPIISNQAYNRYLKLLGDYCGLNKKLHSHLARHSFSCMLLNSGVDMKTISRTLGHSNSKITEHTYAFMNNQTVVNNVRKAML